MGQIPFSRHPSALLTGSQVRVVDVLTMMHEGLSSAQLMSRAGACVAAEVQKRWSRRPVTVLCGPGMNGGDGFIAAAELKLAGWPVTVALTIPDLLLTDEPAAARKRWGGEVHLISPAVIENAELVVDALFGVGLLKDLDGALHPILDEIAARKIPVLSIDLPSGVDANSGQIRGAAVTATVTVAVGRKKPGHLLLPGRMHCGEVVQADLGIPPKVFEMIEPNLFENGPDLWKGVFPVPAPEGHKYDRGTLTFLASGHMTGAGRLATRAAQRAGAGIVHLGTPPEAWLVYASALNCCLLHQLPSEQAWETLLHDTQPHAILLGPGLAPNAVTRRQVLAALRLGKPTLLDGGALSAFAESPETLFSALHDKCVLTPHEGEFERLFTLTGDPLRRASLAAVQTGAVVVLKGYSTVVAAPDGRCVINTNAPATLATAGSGDVLSGTLAGLLSQGMPPFQAAAAAVWLHGESARRFGPGLIAEDLATGFPAIMKDYGLAVPA